MPLAYNTLIVPPGTYLVSGMLYCSRFIDVRGAGPEKSVIRLKDGTFTDPQQPQPVLRMSSTRGAPGSNRATNGSSISLYLEGITIDTGRGLRPRCCHPGSGIQHDPRLDSELTGGGSEHPAIQSDGALYCLRVRTERVGNGTRRATKRGRA